VRSQVNAYGLTPLQTAAYKNNTEMVKCILKQTRLKIWKWGEEAFYGYTLNEIDEYNDSPQKTPGIPVNSIILSEGHFEMLEIPLIGKLMKEKWKRFGRDWVIIFSVLQLLFCIALTLLFIQCYPKPREMKLDWGRAAIDKWWQKALWFIVMIKASLEIVCMVIEMGTLWRANFALQGEILRQRKLSEIQQTKTNSEKIGNRNESEKSCGMVRRLWRSFKVMCCIYFELDLTTLPPEFYNNESKKRAHTSVAGFFGTLSWISNLGFFVAQLTALLKSEMAAKVLLVMMICILICEYVQLFVWFQTYSQVGRFITSVVNILRKDVVGFLVVFLIILLSFSVCFLLLG
jgi:hypothetical protein